MSELKPCPFCKDGGRPMMFFPPYNEEVGCQICGAIAPTKAWQGREMPSGAFIIEGKNLKVRKVDFGR